MHNIIYICDLLHNGSVAWHLFTHSSVLSVIPFLSIKLSIYVEFKIIYLLMAGFIVLFHLVLQSNVNELQSVRGEQRPYSCYICSKSFGRKDQLKTHQGIHRGADNFAVLCVLSHLVGRIIWRCINAYIVVSDHSLVRSVVSRSVGTIFGRCISAYIVRTGHFPVTCVVSHSVMRIVRRHISAHTVESDHFPVTSGKSEGSSEET